MLDKGIQIVYNVNAQDDPPFAKERSTDLAGRQTAVGKQNAMRERS